MKKPKTPAQALEDRAFDFIYGRGGFEPRRSNREASVHFASLAMTDELELHAGDFEFEPVAFTTGLRHDGLILLQQARQMLWFLPERAFTPTALTTYATIAFTAITYFIYACATK